MAAAHFGSSDRCMVQLMQMLRAGELDWFPLPQVVLQQDVRADGQPAMHLAASAELRCQSVDKHEMHLPIQTV